VAQDTQVTELLAALRAGEEGARERLFQRVYRELHELASRQLRHMAPGRTLRTRVESTAGAVAVGQAQQLLALSVASASIS
jgi:hypothetical protein